MPEVRSDPNGHGLMSETKTPKVLSKSEFLKARRKSRIEGSSKNTLLEAKSRYGTNLNQLVGNLGNTKEAAPK